MFPLKTDDTTASHLAITMDYNLVEFVYECSIIIKQTRELSKITK